MRNKLSDLNNHLFEQLERLNDEETTGQKLTEEMNRARSISEIAKQIISNGRLALDAKKLIDNREDADTKLPNMLEG